MKRFLCPGFILLLATTLHAETYSWIDDSGTYNFTEEYSRIPKKYQKKVKLRGAAQPEEQPQLSPNPENAPGQAEKTGAKTPSVRGNGVELSGGKSHAAWRQEMDAMEAELSSIEQRLEELKKQVDNTKRISKVQFDELKKEFDYSRATYDQKYKSYTELIEKVRKAGIVVEIKK